jgi:hypothetical protein
MRLTGTTENAVARRSPTGTAALSTLATLPHHFAAQLASATASYFPWITSATRNPE